MQVLCSLSSKPWIFILLELFKSTSAVNHGNCLSFKLYRSNFYMYMHARAYTRTHTGTHTYKHTGVTWNPVDRAFWTTWEDLRNLLYSPAKFLLHIFAFYFFYFRYSTWPWISCFLFLHTLCYSPHFPSLSLHLLRL